jgi:predicted ATPase
MFHTLERDVQTVEPLARKFLAGAVQQELPLWIAVAQTFLGWCEFESGRLESGIVLLEKQRDFLRAAHLVYWLPTYLCWLAEAYLRAGDLSESKACLRRARDVFDGGGNYWYEVECRRIEACVAARTHTDNPAHAEGAFREALGLARQRGQRGFALRTAHYLAQHLAASGRQQTAHDVLQGELRFFHNQPDRGDRADARALLQSLQTAMRG